MPNYQRDKAVSKKPAVFLDRDGVLNESAVVGGKPYAPRRFADFHLLPGTDAGVADLKGVGFTVVVVTNQPDIGNGLVDPAEVEAMNRWLLDNLAIDALYMCPHSQDENCACRKPRPGMLEAAARDLEIELASSFMVGDRGSDILAGQTVGCFSIFIDMRYAEPLSVLPDAKVDNLCAAVQLILSRKN